MFIFLELYKGMPKKYKKTCLESTDFLHEEEHILRKVS
jgi:hypothetical protein